MSNTIDAFLERFVAASGQFNAAKVGTLGYLGAVYLDLKPEVARTGQTIRINFPDVDAFTDQGVSDWTPEDVNPGYIDVTFNQRPGKAILIRDFEQYMTAASILDAFIDPTYKRAAEYANGQIAALINTTNFNVHAPIVSANQSSISIDDAANAWDLLVNAKVPISGPADASLLYHSRVHRATLTDSNWYQENLVGSIIANSARQDAARPGTAGNVAFQFARVPDQQAPTALTANLTGTVAVTNGSASVVGTGTAFTTQAKSGAYIVIGADAAAYRVDKVADDTHLTLVQAYPGTTASGLNYKRTTFASVAMHRNAIALAVRPLELINNGAVRSRLVMLNGLPMRLMLSYQHLKAGWLMTLDYGMAVKVIRPDFGVVITS